MYDKFSNQAKQIINNSQKVALENNEYLVGTEYLLLSLFKEPNSSCSILLGDLDITEAMLKEAISSVPVFRKNIVGLVLYTSKFKLILQKALKLAKETDCDYVYEEHLFYALLDTDDCIAQVILERLDINIVDLMEEIQNVMDWELESTTKQVSFKDFTFVDNISEKVRKNKLLPLIGREHILDRIQNILNKKYKRNVILIGNAGVGKSTIVEGLAMLYHKNKINKQVLSLNVTSLIAGTKYRGDFEQRIKDFLEMISERDDVIVFIDEIHNIINSGNNDNTLDVANILKPALSRGDISCIGATTLEEYYKYFSTDSALSRRFITIFVDEPNLEETISIVTNLKPYYETYHNLFIGKEVVSYLCEKVEKTIVNRYFPDKAIDLLDESCAYCKIHGIKNVSIEIIDQLIKQTNHVILNDSIIERLEHHPFLKKYFLRYYSNTRFNYQPIVSINCDYSDESQINYFIDDLSTIFNIKSEAVKKLNLANYSEDHSISNIIGAPPGYIGYDNGNTLSKFVQKYPRSIIVLSNIDQCAMNIKQLIKEIITVGHIEDLSSNKVYFTNCIIIAQQKNAFKPIGYIEQSSSSHGINDYKFNEQITLSKVKVENDGVNFYTRQFIKYQQFLKEQNIELVFDNYDQLLNQIDNEQILNNFEEFIYHCIFVDKIKQKLIVNFNLEDQTFSLNG
jgi:ATP-dependent Clp protease ATP-binding subunit ClpC